MKTQKKKRFVPYGINGQYFVYDNKEHHIPSGYGRRPGTKKEIQAICNDLNTEKP